MRILFGQHGKTFSSEPMEEGGISPETEESFVEKWCYFQDCVKWQISENKGKNVRKPIFKWDFHMYIKKIFSKFQTLVDC